MACTDVISSRMVAIFVSSLFLEHYEVCLCLKFPTLYCLPRGRHSEAAHEKGSFVPKNVPGVGWGGVGWVIME